MKILLVDDNDDVRTAVKAILEDEGYQIYDASNGARALEIAETSMPDMIISDILMPEIDGFKLCHTIKGNKKLRKIPYIFYTANYTDPRDEQLAMAMGASRFILKPMMPDEFLTIIKAVIQQHKDTELHVPRMPLEEDAALFRMYSERLTLMLDKKMRDLEKERDALFDSKKTLEFSENRYRVLLDTVPHGIEEIDLSGTITYSNRAYHEMMNAADGELRGKRIWDLMALDSDKEQVKSYLEEIIRNQPPPTPYYTKNLTKDGQHIDVKIDWNYKRDQKGSITGFIAVVTDITGQKTLENTLKEKMSDLERFYEMAVGRELRMKELKEEIARLKSEQSN